MKKLDIFAYIFQFYDVNLHQDLTVLKMSIVFIESSGDLS